MECFLQQALLRHLLQYLPGPMPDTGRRNMSESSPVPLGMVLENRMGKQFVLALSRPHQTQCWRTVDMGLSDSSPPLWEGPCPPSCCNTLDSPFCPSSPFPFLSFLLCVIKRHLLAIHCISEQNLYFRHVELWILNLNTNVAGCPCYFIPFYLSIITPSRIEHPDRCKWVTKMQSLKNNRRKLNNLILIKSCFGKLEFKAEWAAKGCYVSQ